MLTSEELEDYLHLARGDVRRLLSETDIPHTVRGGRTLFLRGDIDAWASQRILGLPGKRLDAYHEKSMRGTRDLFPDDALIPQLLAPADIDLALPSKTRASVIRDMVMLADRAGRVTDRKELVASIEEREALCPTALPGGLALLHARHHAPFRYEGSFIVLGRSMQGVPFSAPDGRPTQLFFLVCCEDDRIHLHALARLAMMALKTDIVDRLFAAADPGAAHAALVEAERSVLPRPSPAGE
jgi:mannitol/fructose-specific phosphotransferase system IIA component (Ntr-type)